jgi:phosphopantothenoylcysteine synthetase/decarboxylase
MIKKQKPKPTLDELIPKEDVKQSFEDADKKEAEYKELKEIVATAANGKKAGRPLQGKSKTRHKITFYINDEQLDYLESLTNRKERTPHAVAKKLFLAHYELHSK